VSRAEEMLPNLQINQARIFRSRLMCILETLLTMIPALVIIIFLPIELYVDFEPSTLHELRKMSDLVLHFYL
jgi:hypothetical protein